MFELSHFLFEKLLNVRKTAAKAKPVSFVLTLHFFSCLFSSCCLFSCEFWNFKEGFNLLVRNFRKEVIPPKNFMKLQENLMTNILRIRLTCLKIVTVCLWVSAAWKSCKSLKCVKSEVCFSYNFVLNGLNHIKQTRNII